MAPLISIILYLGGWYEHNAIFVFLLKRLFYVSLTITRQQSKGVECIFIAHWTAMNSDESSQSSDSQWSSRVIRDFVPTRNGNWFIFLSCIRGQSLCVLHGGGKHNRVNPLKVIPFRMRERNSFAFVVPEVIDFYWNPGKVVVWCVAGVRKETSIKIFHIHQGYIWG